MHPRGSQPKRLHRVDRLHAVSSHLEQSRGKPTRALALAILAASAGCDATPAAPPPGASRVEAVVQAKPAGRNLAEFCDVHTTVGAKALTIPATDVPMAPPKGEPRWVNVWATWCKPCLEEMPRLGSFQKRLAGDGTSAELAFVSADEDAEALSAHLSAHPELPKTARLADQATLKPWFAALGLDDGAGLPVHIFTDAADNVRCVRAGGVNDDHYPFVKDVFDL